MKVKHKVGQTNWSPFEISIYFENEEETMRFYEALQKDSQPEQLQGLGSYIESCSEEQTLQCEQFI